jgi:hypothetical protein
MPKAQQAKVQHVMIKKTIDEPAAGTNEAEN